MNSTTSNVVALREHTPETALAYADAVAAARRDLDEWDRKYIEGKRVLMDKYARAAGAPSGAPPAERVMSKDRAAAAVDLSPRRLMSLISAYHEDHPDRLPLAIQPGGKCSTWEVFVDRVLLVKGGGVTPLR